MPVRMASTEPASTACSIEVSAPSGFTSAHAKGWSNGCRSWGSNTHAQVVTSPPGPTSTISVSSSAVTGSYSVGGTITWPWLPLMPTSTFSRRPVRKAPMTGPVVRLKGYSITIGARSTSASGGFVVTNRTLEHVLVSVHIMARFA